MSETPNEEKRAWGGWLAALNDVLQQPRAALERLETADRSMPFGLLGCALAGWLLYGAAAGFFQGGGQIVVSALKGALIVAGSLLLCLPSLYVFSSLTAGHFSGRRFLAALAGFGALLGLLLAGLVPVAWLFSVSSRYLLALVALHLALWTVSVLLAARILLVALPGAGTAIAIWALLLLVVSLQVATYLRPVLWRPPGAPLVESGKMFFLEHLRDVAQRDGEVARDESR